MRLLILLFPIVILAHIYVGRKLYLALATIFGLSQATVFPYLGAALLIFMLFPITLICIRAFDPPKADFLLNGNSRVMDAISIPFWFGALVSIELTPWLLLIDLVKLPFYPLYRQFEQVWLHFQTRLEFALIALYAAYVFSRMFIDTLFLQVERHDIAIGKLPPRLDGLRIAHISDAKLDSRTKLKKLKRYVNKTQRLNPDLIFFTGDLMAAGSTLLKEATAVLGSLKCRYGVLACIGDCDEANDSGEICRCLREQNVVIWQDSNQFVLIGADRLLITFITNHAESKASLDTLNFLMGQQPRGSIDIAIAHQPSESVIELAAERGYQLFLAGHTCGGQVVLKILGVTVCKARMETPFYKGVHIVQNMLVSINNGLGVAQLPFRFRAQARVTLLKLRCPSSAKARGR